MSTHRLKQYRLVLACGMAAVVAYFGYSPNGSATPNGARVLTDDIASSLYGSGSGCTWKIDEIDHVYCQNRPERCKLVYKRMGGGIQGTEIPDVSLLCNTSNKTCGYFPNNLKPCKKEGG